MVITVTLPKVRGYVESILNGEHVYKNIRTGEIAKNPDPIPDVYDLVDVLEASNLEAQQTITDLDLEIIEAQQTITDLELEILGGAE